MILLELPAQGVEAHSKQFGRLALVSAGMLVDFQDVIPLHLRKGDDLLGIESGLGFYSRTTGSQGIWQKPGVDGPAFCQIDRSLQNVSEFPDVAWEVIAHEKGQGLRLDSDISVTVIKAFKNSLGKPRDILPPFSQGGEMKPRAFKPVIEVLAKHPFGNQPL